MVTRNAPSAKTVNEMATRGILPAEEHRSRAFSAVFEIRSMTYDINTSALDERATELQAASLETGELAPYDPESARWLCWLGLLVVLSSTSSFVTAFEIAFYEAHEGLSGLTVANWLVDLIFVANIALHADAGFLLDGQKEMRLEVARRYYLRSALFVADAVACMPLDFLQAATGWQPWWRVNKLLRLPVLFVHLARLEARIARQMLVRLIQVNRLILMWFLMVHLAACLRILLSAADDTDDYWWARDASAPWKVAREAMEGPVSTVYLGALYWCMGLMTGYGDGDVPETPGQYLFTLIIINAGVFTFAYTVGVLGTLHSEPMRLATNQAGPLSVCANPLPARPRRFTRERLDPASDRIRDARL
jgi:hypothetical protein